MAKLPIRWIEGRTYCHATEDAARVQRALDFAVPGDPPEREGLRGHFGNDLVRLTRRLEGSASIRATWERWTAGGLLERLATQADARVDEDGVLHFRLDKQAAFEERWSLATDADTIDVRVKLLAYPAKPEEARRVAKSILAGAT
jgi:RNA binding exosome subunit